MNRRSRNRKGKISLRVSLCLYVFLCLFLIVWFRGQNFKMESDIGMLTSLREELLSERRIMVAKRSSLLSSEHIEKVALTSLGMTVPTRENVFYVRQVNAPAPYRASTDVDK